MRFKPFLLAAALLLPFEQVPAADAPTFPTRPVRLILPYPAGAGLDAIGRLLAKQLSQMWNQPVVVENLAGATTTLATKAVIDAKPDGYTIGVITSQAAINPGLFKSMPYKTSDFKLVTEIVEVPLYMFANPKIPGQTFEGMLKYAKENPNTIKYASVGTGSITHIPIEALLRASGVKMRQIPYIGVAQGTTAALAGEVDFTLALWTAVKGQVAEGRLRTLAVTGAKRTPVLPDVPAIPEFAPQYPGFSEWYGNIVPKDTPQPIVDKIYADVKKALESPEISERFKTDGNISIGSSPAEFQSFFQVELTRWSKTLSDLGLSLQLK